MFQVFQPAKMDLKSTSKMVNLVTRMGFRAPNDPTLGTTAGPHLLDFRLESFQPCLFSDMHHVDPSGSMSI